MSKGKKPEIIETEDDKTGGNGAETPSETAESQVGEGEQGPVEADAGTEIEGEAAASDTPEDAPATGEETPDGALDDSPETASDGAQSEATGDELAASEADPDDTEAEIADQAPDQDTHHDQAEAAPAPADAEVEHHGSSFASTALMLLVGALVVIGLTLWAAPKLAPHLPAGIAQYLNPVPNSTQDDIATLQTRVAELDAQGSSLEGLAERLGALEAAGTDTNALEEALAAAAQAQQAAEVASGEAQALRDRQGQIATQLDALEGELRALTEALSGDGEGSAVPAELQAALKAMQSRVDTLSDAAAGFATRDEVEGAIGTIEAQIAEVAAEAEAAKLTGSDALGEAEQALRGAALRGAAAALVSRVNGGLPYAGALTELEELSGAVAPDALRGPAAAGLGDQAQLSAGLPAAARAAIDAEREADAGEGAASQIAAWLGTQVSSRPTVETEGESVGAILSRVEARLSEGALPDALAEAQALPQHAQDAMADWLSQLEARVGAEAALSDYIAATGGAS